MHTSIDQCIILNELSHSQKDKCHAFSHFWFLDFRNIKIAYMCVYMNVYFYAYIWPIKVNMKLSGRIKGITTKGGKLGSMEKTFHL